MKTLLRLGLIVILSYSHVYAQDHFLRKHTPVKKNAASKSTEYVAPCEGSINAPTADLNWLPALITKPVAKIHESESDEELTRVKAEKTLQKYAHQPKLKNNEVNTQAAAPTLGRNFAGNPNNGSSPLDNSIAVSNAGLIISVSNTTVSMYDVNGTNVYFNTLGLMFNDPAISAVCDPLVIYDKQADRFILFFQECSGNSSNSYLCLAFSKSNNPAIDGWWKYKLSGNPANDNTWFDYPKMAVSTNEVYITGNLFNNSGGFSQAVIYQLQKANAYSGNTFNYQVWKNIDGNPFTLLPLGNGQGLPQGPGCLFVSTLSGGGSILKAYELTDDMSAANEQLNYFEIPTPTYSTAGDAAQLGSSCVLDNGDCRALSGFLLNGTAHMVIHADVSNGWNGIVYARIDATTGALTTAVYGTPGEFDNSYPSIASIGTNENDKSVMISYGRSGPTIRPEVRVIACDNAMNWSNSVLVKSSTSYVSYTSSSVERWGDYTGIARKYNNGTPTVWMNGMYGNTNHTWDTWIAEITNTATGVNTKLKNNEFKVFPNPVYETFNLTFSLNENTELNINIYDAMGKLVKQLYQGKGKVGENVFSFNKANLAAGIYTISIESNQKIIKAEKIVVGE